jgi:quercetin dioxygenase-like cupin family protein
MTGRVVIELGAGEPMGGGMIRKLLSSETGGHLTAFEATVPPGMFVPPHVHAAEDEITYVISGAIHVVVGESHRVAAAGALVVKPRGVPHAFWNEGPEPAGVLELVTPGTLDDYFPELFAIAARLDLSDDERAAAMDAHHHRFGIRFDHEAGEELVQRYRIPVNRPGNERLFTEE